MPGSTSANFHEGSRSEYLAHYVFASLGTAVAVPHQEDTGLDIYCTLTERLGQEIWPHAYFSVQVKSNPKPWTFPNKRSVKWLMENPMPVFLCVVYKAALKLQLYHTCPRFHIWSLPVRPDKLELIPGTEGKGECVKFEGGTSYSLSAPILALTINDIHNENSRKKVKEVLKFWIGIEEQNLRRVKNKILQFSMPDKYETNAKPGPAVIRYWSVNPSAKDRKQAISSLEPQLTWVAQILWNSGDMRGAVRALLLHRHWFGDLNLSAASALRSIHHALNIRIGKPGDDAFEAIDELGANLDKELEKLSNSSKITMG